jgi:hypothetical protein
MLSASLVLALLVFLSVCAFLTVSAAVARRAARAHEAVQALNLAEAGLAKARNELSSAGGDYLGERDTALGRGTFTVAVRRRGERIVIESVGRVPDAVGPEVERRVRVTADCRPLPGGGIALRDAVWEQLPGALDLHPSLGPPPPLEPREPPTGPFSQSAPEVVPR